MAENKDVVVVGAGLAGLCTALRLSASELDVVVCEAGDRVGGRVGTDQRDGLLLDRGFQLYNPAYPEAARVLDHGALELRSFVPGVEVGVGATRHRIADPRRVPSWGLASMRAPVGSLSSKARFALLALRASRRETGTGEDISTQAALSAAGISPQLVESVLRPFLAGVFLERDLSTSSRFLDLVLTSFVHGTPAVPARGMQAIPEQLAGRLPVDAVRLATPVHAVRSGEVDTLTGTLRARAVVVATDPTAAHRLLPGLDVPAMHSVTTWYHLAPRAPIAEPVLVLDGQDRGPVINSVVLTNAAPSYTGDSRVLVSSSVLGIHSTDDDDHAVRRHLALLYGTDTAGWSTVAAYPIAEALPAMIPPFSISRPVRLGEGVYVAGDHRDTSSIQGAMLSGRRAADAVLEDLRRAR